MKPKYAWGRVEPPTTETGLGQPKDVFSRNESGYPMWTEVMKKAIGPLRQAGRKWYSLYDKMIAPANVEAAWDRMNHRISGKKRRQGAGVDGMTVAQFAKRAEAELQKLVEQLSTGRCQPSPVRRLYIPKAGSNKLRPLGLPTVRDRVVQEACRSMIEPIFEAEFLANSHGFRPGKSVETACVQVEQNLLKGREWVIDLDIEKCYDSIPQEPLVDRVARRVSDGKVLELIRSFLKSGVMEEMEVRYETTGTPQGGIVSPLLANIYLHDLDMALEARGVAWVRYADDVVALCRSREEAEQTLEYIREVLGQLGLKLSVEKTRIVHYDEGFDYLGWHYQGKRRWPRPKSVDKLRDRLRALTRRNRPGSLQMICTELEPIQRGWFQFFRQGNTQTTFEQLDGWLRRRMRSLLRTRLKLGGISPLGHDHQQWRNSYFAQQGFFSLADHLEDYRRTVRQLKLFSNGDWSLESRM
jgi:RNA-directed DNA polymerase